MPPCRLVDAECLSTGFFKEINVKPKVIFEVEHSNIVVAMVKGGLGISIIPELFFGFSGVVTAGLKPKLYREIGLGVRCGQSAAPATKAFIATAQSWLIANGYDCPEQRDIVYPSNRYGEPYHK